MTEAAGNHAPQQRLAPAEAEAIVAIRGLLDEAVSRSSDSTVVGRRVAAVLMDGAAEAAMAAGLSKCNDSPKDRDGLDELRRRLVEHLRTAGRLGSTENFDGWADVRRLRMARNGAQHHQIPPDHQTLVGWSGGVRRFVAHVVAAAFDAEISSVSAGSSIAHDELRARFMQAERAQAQGEPREAVEHLQQVLNAALRLWNEQRKVAASLPWLSLHDELGVAKRIEAATRHLDETLTIAPFALDLGEYFWWRGLVRDARDQRVVITANDAARALTFVFTWVIRWESFSARYLSRERLRGEFPDVPPPSRRPDGAAELDADREPTVKVRFTHEYPGGPPREEWVLRVPYRLGLPEPTERYSSYDHHLDQELWRREPPPPWGGHVYRDGGDIQLTVDRDAFDPEAVLDELEVRFDRALGRQREEAARAAAARAELDRRQEAVARIVPDTLAIRIDGAQPFADVTLEAYEPTPSVLVRFTEEFAKRMRTDLNEVRPADLPGMPSEAHLRYDGVQVPFDSLREAPRLATEAVAAADRERQRIRESRAAVFAAAEAFDAAAKKASRRRSTRPTSSG